MFLAPMRLRAVAGARVGSVTAALLCLWLLIIVMLQHSFVLKARSGESYHAAVIMGLYLVGGAFAGTLVGVLLPLMRWRIGAVIVGALGVIPFCVGVLATRSGFSAWGRIETISLVIFALAFGGGGGLIVRELVRSAGGIRDASDAKPGMRK